MRAQKSKEIRNLLNGRTDSRLQAYKKLNDLQASTRPTRSSSENLVSKILLTERDENPVFHVQQDFTRSKKYSMIEDRRSSTSNSMVKLRHIGESVHESLSNFKESGYSRSKFGNTGSKLKVPSYQYLKTEKDERRKSTGKSSAVPFSTHPVDRFCNRLEKKLQTTLPKSTNCRLYYSVVKPFDFLVHQNSKIEELRKVDIGSTFKFTKRVACPVPRESASTKKLMENLRSLGSKVQSCILF